MDELRETGTLLLTVRELKEFVDARLTAAGVARERELWGITPRTLLLKADLGQQQGVVLF
jgi:hypothetical protein